MSRADPFAEARVAVVDDNRNFRSLLRGMLRQIGVRRIDLFGDPDEALRHVGRVGVDLALVDLVMPGRNGIDWIRTARRGRALANPDMAILLMSGHAVRAVLEAAVAAGIDGFLVKPLSPETLAGHARGTLFARAPYVGGPDGYWGPDVRAARRRLAEIERGVERRRAAFRPAAAVSGPPPSTTVRPGLPGLDVEIVDRSRYSGDLLFLD